MNYIPAYEYVMMFYFNVVKNYKHQFKANPNAEEYFKEKMP
jgi:hypothetical protein